MTNMFTGQAALHRTIASLDLYEVLAWCKHYHVSNRYPVSTLKRFGIGLYQIHQGQDWANTDGRYEGYMSAVLNWFMLSEGLGVPVFKYLEFDCFRVEPGYVSSETFIHSISMAQQMVHYADRLGQIRRSDCRYNTEVLAEHLGICISYCLYKIPLKRMKKTMQESIDILTGDL